MQAMGVIGQYADYSALANTAVRALVDHAADFLFERRQPPDATFDLDEVGLRDGVDLHAGTLRLVSQLEQLPDGIDLEAQLARMPDEA